MIAPTRLNQTDRGTVSAGNGIEFFPVQHASTFMGRASTMASTYRDYDVALRNSIENARLMRNDSSIMECLEARQRAVALLKWHIEPEDDRSPEQKQLAEEMTRVMMRTPRFMELRRVLQEAVWYGKSAVQCMYNADWINGYRRFCILSPDRDTPAWLPIHGDKLVFRHDDLSENDRAKGRYPFQVGIRVGSGYRAGQKVRGKYEVEHVSSQYRGTEAVDRGMAYFVDQEDRSKLIIHKHSIEDGAYEDILSAGSIHGIGVRSRIYWDWLQKQEIQAMLLAYIERYHGGIEIYRFPLGNDEAEKAVDSAIRNRQPGRAALKVPIPMGEDAMQYGVEVFESSMAGVQQMQDLLTNFYGHRIKRYILGQILSSESEATGLGSGVADLHLESLLQIIEYDATGLEETITEEPLRRLQHANFPSSKGIRLRFKIDTREADSDAKLNAVRQAWEMGARVKESDVLDQCGLSAPTAADRVLPAPGGGQGQQPPGMPGMPHEGPPKIQASVPGTVTADPHQDQASQYARQGTFNWDESEHPRNEKGEFVEKAGESATSPRKLREGQVEMRQAKAGGETSDVDGKFYKGGQWLPVHGLYSGQEKPDKADKPEIATEDKFAPVASENGKGGRPVARQRSPEDVEREREQRQWETVQAGPLGRALHLGERQHYIKGTSGSLPAWTELARSGEVSDDRFEAVSEWAEQKSRKTHDEMVRPLGGSAYVPSNRYGAEKVSDADWAWEQSQVTDAAKADIEWVSKRNDRKVLKQHPQVALAREWVSHLLSNDQSVETLWTLHRLLTGEGGESGQELGESRRGPAGLTVREAIEATGAKGEKLTHKNAVQATYLYTDTTPADWKAVKVEGMKSVDDGKGGERMVPEFVMPSGYTQIKTPWSSDSADNTCCHLCGTSIKHAYHIQNDETKNTMLVGSECVTQFGEGDNGHQAAKKSIAAANRDFVSQLQTARDDLRKAGMYEEEQIHLGQRTGRTVRKWSTHTKEGKAAKAIYDQITDALKHTTGEDIRTGERPFVIPSTDRVIANWRKAKGEEAAAALQAFSEYLSNIGQQDASRYSMEWREEDHPRDNRGKFSKKSKGHSMHDFQIDPDARSKWLATGQAAAFRVQDSRFPLPEKSKSTWHGDEEETMPGVSGYANFINAWEDIVFGTNESVTGDNYAQQVSAAGGVPALVVMQGREIDGPGAEIIVPNPKIAAVFHKDDLVKSFREYIGEAYGSLDEHDYRTAPIDEILSNYEWSQEDIEGAVNYLLSHQSNV